MKKWTTWMLAALAGIALLALAANEDANALMGAGALIREITGEAIAPGKNTAESFTAATALFKQNAAAMAPEEAAEKWLQLSDALFTLPKPEYWRSDEAKLFKALFEILPPPEAWPFIREGLAARQEAEASPRRTLQQVLFAWMACDPEAARELFSTVEKNNAIRRESETAEVKKILSGKKGKGNSSSLEMWTHLLSSSNRSSDLMDLSDIANEEDAEEAEELLRKIFKQPRPLPSIRGAETLAMAQRVALGMRDEIETAHWCLVDDSDAGRELYALFMERFSPYTDKSGQSRKQLQQFRGALERLATPMLVEGRVEEALELAVPFALHVIEADASDDADAWRFTAQSRAVPLLKRMDFYLLLMERIPNFPPNDNFVGIALSCEREDEAGAILLKRMEAEDLTPSRRRALQQAYVSFLLAADKIAEAVALRMEIMGEVMKMRTPPKDFNSCSYYEIETAKLALLLDDAETQSAALDMAAAVWRKNMESTSRLEHLAELYEESGRAAEVEPLFIEYAREKNPSKETWSHDYAELLVKFYARHNRFEDVMTLLDDAPWWASARDVMNIRMYSWNNKRGGVMAGIANALHETGQTDKARQFLAHFMRDNHARDWMYELLLKIAGNETDAFIAEMDALYARDAFEERPLIWKAEALRRAGRLEEAEAAARHALKVDPTDGESPAGERVLAYAVLGDILADLGKAEDAQFFRDVVKSVRIAEEGDDLKDLGLVKRSLDRFAEAEALFADAYCVQWRLAEQMREAGRPEEARKHYEIAFERMPEQFGRVASLCFGCMSVFGSDESVSAAEGVLGRLAETPPVRPAVYYLLGQLREEQKKYDEACEWYVKALGADPDYFDVLWKLYKLKNKSDFDGVDWVALQNQMIRLDPLGRHSHFAGEDVLDWQTLWAVRNAAVQNLPPALDAVFPLAANIRRLEASGKVAQNNRGDWKRWWHVQNANEMLAGSELAKYLERMDKAFLEK